MRGQFSRGECSLCAHSGGRDLVVGRAAAVLVWLCARDLAADVREIQPQHVLFHVAVSVRARASSSRRACEWLASADSQVRYIDLDPASDEGRPTVLCSMKPMKAEAVARGGSAFA